MEEFESNYIKFRGKCRELSEAAVREDPTLTLVRGHYICPIWGPQTHWWTERPDGSVYDPTVLQFPSEGRGEYVPFNGIVTCAECGKEMKEEDAGIIQGRYAYCSDLCYCAFVGLDVEASFLT